MKIDIVRLAAAALKTLSALYARITESLIAPPGGAEQDALAAEWEVELDRREVEIDATSGNLRSAEEVFRAARRQSPSR